MPRDSVNKMPVRDWLERMPDGKVYKVTVKRGKFREYESRNVCLGTVEHIEEERPDLIPKIRNWELPDARGVVPIGERLPLEGKHNLRWKLSMIDDPVIVREMMAGDTRPGAETFYIDRLDAIRKGVTEEEELVEA